VDTRHWRVDWLWIHSTKGDVTRSSTMEKKDIGVVICCRQPSSRKVDEWVSEWVNKAATSQRAASYKGSIMENRNTAVAYPGGTVAYKSLAAVRLPVSPPRSGGLGSTPGSGCLLVHAGQLSAYLEINISCTHRGSTCVLLNLWQATRTGFKCKPVFW